MQTHARRKPKRKEKDKPTNHLALNPTIDFCRFTVYLYRDLKKLSPRVSKKKEVEKIVDLERITK